MKKNKEDLSTDAFAQKITLPWLIISIASMVAFLAFLIAMFFHFYPAVFFGVFLLIIAAGLFVEGLHKKKENYLSGNFTVIMAILCIICAVVFINMN